MRTVDNFFDYELIDADDGMRLERWKDIILIRPDPQIIWHDGKRDERWNKAHAVYHRSSSGGGYWERLRAVPDVWSVSFEDLNFNLKPMCFKHTGLFHEQAVNWKLASRLIKESKRENIKVLNMFAYTGGATVACLKAGAAVTHVDASKGMVAWAKENAVSSDVSDRPVRWLVDDCLKFAKREIRRESKYDAIIMDPPSYGRGPNGEIWKLENQLGELLEVTAQLLSDDPLFFFLNSYTGGLSPTILNYMLKKSIKKGFNAEVYTDEIGLRVTKRDIVLPCGNTTFWINGK